MRLKFIGKDNSMGLIHGEVYGVEVVSEHGYIWVIIPKFKFSRTMIATWECPYSSPQTFAENWSLP